MGIDRSPSSFCTCCSEHMSVRMLAKDEEDRLQALIPVENARYREEYCEHDGSNFIRRIEPVTAWLWVTLKIEFPFEVCEILTHDTEIVLATWWLPQGLLYCDLLRK